MCVGVGGTTISNILANTAADQLGANNFTAAMAGDAYLPAALGPEGTGKVEMGSKLGEKFSSQGFKKTASLLGRGLLAQELYKQQQPRPSMPQPPGPGPDMSHVNSAQIAFPAANQAGGANRPLADYLRGMDSRDPRMAALLQMMWDQQGGIR